MLWESFSTGKTTPSEVATSTIATNSGDFTKPPARRLAPIRIAMRNDTANPSAVTVTIRPRRRSASISRPERKSKKASPTRARIETGASGFAQPSPEGPITIPSKISSTIAGSRTRGKKPSAKGASRPAAATMSRLVNTDSRFHVRGVTRLACATHRMCLRFIGAPRRVMGGRPRASPAWGGGHLPRPPCLRRSGQTRNRSRRQVRAGLLRRHISGAPGGPVLVLARPVKQVRPPHALLVLGMGGLGPLERASQVGGGGECRRGGIDPAGQPGGDLLDQPRVAVGVGEGAERPVAGAFGVGAGLPCLGRERRAVPDLAGVDAAAGEVGVGRHDVGDDQPSYGRAGRGRDEPGAEGDRGRGARRGELDDAKAVQRGDVGVEPPAQALVELLGTVDVGHGNDLDL